MHLFQPAPALTALAVSACLSFSALAEGPEPGRNEAAPASEPAHATPVSTPEPNTTLLAGLGGLILLLFVFRRK